MIPAILALAAVTAWQGPSSLPIPAPAADAGYTTLAFHADFTAPIFGQTANWLDCAGAVSPQLWIAGYDPSVPAPPCSRMTITNDGGIQVLDLHRDVADEAAEAVMFTTINIRSGLNRGTDFPNAAYYQATFRTTTQAMTDNYQTGQTSAWWTWSDTALAGLSPEWTEFDFFELAPNSGQAPPGRSLGNGYDDSCMHIWGDQGSSSVCTSGWGDYYSVDQTIYHTFGGLITQDAASGQITMCTFIDGVLQRHPDGSAKCGTISATDSMLNERIHPILTAAKGYNYAASVDVLIKDMQIWTCENWRGPLVTPGHAC